MAYSRDDAVRVARRFLDAALASEGVGFDEQFEIFHEAQEYNSALEVICFTREQFEDDGGALIRRIKKEGLELWRESR